LEDVHLFLDDVGDLAYPTGEERRFLEYGRIDTAVAKGSADTGGRAAHQLPIGLV